MSTSRRRFLALGASALCSLSLGSLASHASPARAAGSAPAVRPALDNPPAALRNLRAPALRDVTLPLPRTCANAFGERRSHGRATPHRWQRAP